MEYIAPNSSNSCNVTYMRTRTGPNWFRVYYKNAAYVRFTPKEVGRVFGIAKFTPSVNEIREWCYTMIKEYGSDLDKSNPEYLKHEEKEQQNTDKMVV